MGLPYFALSFSMEKRSALHKPTILSALALLQLVTLYHACSSISKVGACLDREREALNTFREALQDPFGLLSSWDGGNDCCKWSGVSCDNDTGYVSKLDLHGEAFSGSIFSGQIDPVLLQLKHLHFLDLSYNDFGGISIPKFLGYMKELRHLNLSWAGLNGRIPHQLGNLSKLVSLQLSFNSLRADNLMWLANMSSLDDLDLSGVNLSLASQHWVPEIMSSCPSLVELALVDCDLSFIPPSLPSVNFTSLRTLTISLNHFNSAIPNWIANITNLTSLVLSHNEFHGWVPSMISELPNLEELSIGGLDDNPATDWSEFLEGSWDKLKTLDLFLDHGPIPESIAKITSLESLTVKVITDGGIFPVEILGRLKNLSHLDFSYCNLTGPIPAALGGLSSLTTLDLSRNQLNGTIPEALGGLSSLEELFLQENHLSGNIPTALGRLSKLKILYVSANFLTGNVSEAHFENARELEELGLFGNPLVLDLQPDWIPPFQIQHLNLRSVRVGPFFPLWLQTQKMIRILDLSNAAIDDVIPNWLWDVGTNTEKLDLSYNVLSGQLPNNLEMMYLQYLDLSGNRLTGSIPCILGPLVKLDLSSNQFSGPIPLNFTYPSTFFSVSGNQISGSIPTSICDMPTTMFLDLSNNSLSGTIPPETGNCTGLVALDLSDNYLWGRIPTSMGSLTSLNTLHLESNGLSGELPLSLQNCTSLVALNLDGNKFSGPIPSWIGERFTGLRFLRLRSNLFTRGIPPQLFHLASLQMFDVAFNQLSGPIPTAFEDLRAMRNETREDIVYKEYPAGYSQQVTGMHYGENSVVSTKGQNLIFTKTIFLLTCIDLSSNNFSGKIPDALTTLSALNVLNLSGNHLIGNIPRNIGRLEMLESLDLSRNELSGTIPLSISDLHFLSHLNLSHNKLSGSIPSGKQLQSLPDPTIYSGNVGLCGFPLSDCGGNKTDGSQDGKNRPGEGDQQDEEDDNLMFWFYIGAGPGIVVGFWTICGLLILKKSWRAAYFRLVDEMTEKFLTLLILWMARLKQKK